MDPTTLPDWIAATAALIGALAAVATAILTGGLLIAALIAGAVALGTLFQMRNDSRGQREDSARATRPYVHVRMVPSIAGIDAWDLMVENTGRTSAHDLRLVISPGNESTSAGDLVTALVQKFADAGHTLHPGESLRMYWVLGATEKDPTGYPRATVTVKYRDSAKVPYEEPPVTLDPGTVGATPVPYTGKVRNSDDDPSIPRNTLNTLRAIAHHLGESNR